MRLSLLLWTGLLSITVANPILDDSDASLGIPDYQDFEAATDSSHDIELADAACQSLDNAELVYDQENLVIRDVGFLDVVKGQNFCPVKPSSNIPRQRKPRRKPNQTLVQPKPLPRPTFAPEEGWDGKCKHPSWPLALCCATRRFGIDGYKKCTPYIKGSKECEEKSGNYLVCCLKHVPRLKWGIDCRPYRYANNPQWEEEPLIGW